MDRSRNWSKYRLFLWGSLITLSGVLGCESQKKVEPEKKEVSSQQSGPRAKEYFSFDDSERIQKEKVEFLQTALVSMSKTTDEQAICDVNLSRGPSFQPNTPVIHTHNHVEVDVPLAVRFSDAFRATFPLTQEIKDSFFELPLESLDLFWVVQKGVEELGNSLKPGYWLFPDRPRLVNIGNPGFSDEVKMAVFESTLDHLDELQVTGKLDSEFQVLFQNGRISPNTGRLNLSDKQMKESFAMYSLIYQPKQKKAALTLHWVLSKEHAQSMRTLCEQVAKSENNHLDDLLKRLSSESPFRRTDLLERLEAFAK